MGSLGVQELTKIPVKWRKWFPQCSNKACEKPALPQFLGKRHSGTSIANEWFCCLDCFEQVARFRLSQLKITGTKLENSWSMRTPMGLLLLSRGTLSSDQLQVALERQRATGDSIGDVLQQLGFATAEQVTAAVAAQWACPVFSLRRGTFPSQVRIPRRLLELYEILPVHFAESDRRLLVGCVKGVLYHTLRTIENITSCRTSPCFITARDYRQYLNANPDSDTKNELVFETISGTDEVACLIRNYVSQLGAQLTRFGAFGDYLWARVWGRTQEVDLLFRMKSRE